LPWPILGLNQEAKVAVDRLRQLLYVASVPTCASNIDGRKTVSPDVAREAIISPPVQMANAPMPPRSDIQKYIWNQERIWADRITPYLSGKILKVGNGLGYLTTFFQQAGFNIVTLDVSEASAALNRGNALLYDGEVFPFKDHTFDCVVFAFVLHHTPNPFTLIREAHRVGARIIVLEETYGSLLSKVDLVYRDFYVNLLAQQDGPIYWNSYFRNGMLERHFAHTGHRILHHYSEPKRTYLKELFVAQQ
jgi:SAM-dependent methyltransferase